MPVYLKIALRYIFTRRTYNFITVITTISIIGIVLGVAALIAVLSIFNGLQGLSKNQIVAWDPHLKIVPHAGAYMPLPDTSKIPGNARTAAVVEGKGILIKGNTTNIATIKTFGVEDMDFYSEIAGRIYFGQYSFSNINSLPGIMLGAGIADKLGALPGDTVFIISPDILQGSVASFGAPDPERAVVTGIFMSGLKDYDKSLVLADLTFGRKLFRTGKDKYTSLDIRFDDFKKADAMAPKLRKSLPENFDVLTWKDLNSQLYGVMQFERIAVFAILSIIIILAVFNVFASLTMTVTEKQRDIGVLASMGASGDLIRKIFLSEGVLIGALSTFLGTIMGLGFCFGQIEFGWFKINAINTIVDEIPVEVFTGDVIMVIAISMTMSSIATIYPARKASSVKVIEALRSE